MRKYEEICTGDPPGRSYAVRYSVSLKINTPVIPVASYPDLKKLLETAAREDRAQIILTKSRSVIGL